jgi:tRNA A-37 threonylcarbamoyl transferase component Bud32
MEDDNMSLEIMSRYKNILDEGEISYDILNEIIKKIGFLDNLSVKCSNQTSFVLVSDNIENVFQYFVNRDTANNIFFIISKLSRNPIIVTSLIINKKYQKITYRFTEYIVPFIRYIPGNIIIWKKIVPINSFIKENIPQFIQKNIYKLLWDIGKAITGLHNNYIIHGDISIDNIGICKNEDYINEHKFVLYDFDGTRKYFSYNDFISDYYKFQRSIKYHYDVGKIPKEDINLVDKLFSNNDSILESVLESYMDKFKQTDIEKALESLENMKIEFI